MKQSCSISRSIRHIRFLAGWMILIFHCTVAYAATVSEPTARQIAEAFFSTPVPLSVRSATLQGPARTATSEVALVAADQQEEPAYYIFNRSGNQGFVIVSGQEGLGPILAYSTENTFVYDEMPVNVREWLTFYRSGIEQLRASNAGSLGFASVPSANYESGVSPILGNIRWNQGTPYNQFCPWDVPTSSRAVTGCVATMMAQVMKHHAWPVTGTGTFSYTENTYGILSANFGATTYPWSLMLDAYHNGSTPAQDSAVALLNYHCGVAVQMQYSPWGSAASFTKAAQAFTKYFGYDTDLQRVSRLYHSDASWRNLIRQEIDAGRPVPYSATTDQAEGHAFVCDGYDTNGFFHMNWGWGGTCNGYYDLGFLNPETPGSGNSATEYTENQFILTGVMKPDGLQRPSWELSVYNQGLTPNKTYWKVTSSNRTCSIGFGLMNNGLNKYTGYYGIGILSNGNWTEKVKGLTVLESSTYIPSITFSSVDVYSLADGSYLLGAVYKHTDSTSWSLAKASQNLNNTLLLTISTTGGSKYASISLPEMKPRLELTSALGAVSGCYQNKKAYFETTVTNLGKEFNSYVELQLVSVDNPALKQSLGTRKLVCPAGSTVTLRMSDTVQVSPGNYTLSLMYDSTNNNSLIYYKKAAGNGFDSGIMTVKASPGEPKLRLVGKPALSTGNTFGRNQDLILSARISNLGGYFDSGIYAFLYPKGGGSSLAYLGPTPVHLDSLEEKDIILTGSFDVAAGDYNLYLIQEYQGYGILNPQESALLSVSITNSSTSLPASTQVSGLARLSVSNGHLEVFSEADVLSIHLYDLCGRLVCEDCSHSVLSLTGISPGIYVVRILTTKGIYTSKIRNP